MNGYISIDCQGMNLLAQSSQTISGLYAACAEAMETNKPVFAVNCVYGEGRHMSPVPVMGVYGENVIIFTASILQIEVSTEDEVTIIPLVTNEAKTSTRKTK